MQLGNRDRVLITGGCGFVGSALIREIQANCENVHIKVIDNLCNGAAENIEGLGIEFIEGDILDDNKVRVALDNVDVLFHLAALPFIPHSYEDPGSYFRINAGGSMELFVKALDSGVKRIVYVSTCEVYGVAESFPIDESHPTNPVSIYAASKLAAEKAAYALYKEHNLPVY